jgi:hypothetical protein
MSHNASSIAQKKRTKNSKNSNQTQLAHDTLSGVPAALAKELQRHRLQTPAALLQNASFFFFG